jgi:hypothetical protein
MLDGLLTVPQGLGVGIADLKKLLKDTAVVKTCAS